MNNSYQTLAPNCCQTQLPQLHAQFQTQFSTQFQALCAQFPRQRRDRLIAHLSGRYHWSTSKADQTVEEYLKFLYVASLQTSLHTGIPLIPSREVDCVWEADILQSTARYMQTCQALCGKMIHHAQREEIHETATFESIEVAFRHTQALLAQHFGASSNSQALSESTITNSAAACGAL